MSGESESDRPRPTGRGRSLVPLRFRDQIELKLGEGINGQTIGPLVPPVAHSIANPPRTLDAPRRTRASRGTDVPARANSERDILRLRGNAEVPRIAANAQRFTALVLSH